jgi:Sulfotransferase domain
MLSRRERLRKLLKRTRNQFRARQPSPTIPVFVLGEMRSGTNMLVDCFDASPDTETYNETDDDAFVDYELRDLAHITGLIDRARASHVVFKSIADSNRAGELLEQLPGARAIWIFRQFQDVINSAIAKWHQHNEYLRLIDEDPVNARWRARNLDPEQVAMVRNYRGRGLSETSARALIWYLRNQFYFKQRLDASDRVLLINYESLVTDPARYLRHAFEFVDLPFDERFFAHVSTQSVRKQPEPEIDSEVLELCSDLLARLHAAAAG